MPAATAYNFRGYKARETGLKVAQLFSDGYTWGWVCWTCSRPAEKIVIQQSGFETRDGARREAKKHEKRRGH